MNNNTNDTTASNFDKNRGSESALDFTTISELDFNEFHKRQILEEFLSKDEIKKYLYTLIFTNNNNSSNSANNSQIKPKNSKSNK